MSKDLATCFNPYLWDWPYVLCLWSRWYLHQFYGGTLPTWPSTVYLVISFGRECCCYLFLLVDVSSKLWIFIVLEIFYLDELRAYKINFSLIWQSHRESACVIHGVCTIQIHFHVYGFPVCISFGMLWNHMDTYCRNIVSIAFLPSDKHTRTPPPQGVSVKLSSAIRCGWIRWNCWNSISGKESLTQSTLFCVF